MSNSPRTDLEAEIAALKKSRESLTGQNKAKATQKIKLLTANLNTLIAEENEASTDTDTATDTEVETDTATDTEVETDTATDTEVETDTATDTEVETDTATDTEVETKIEMTIVKNVSNYMKVDPLEMTRFSPNLEVATKLTGWVISQIESGIFEEVIK